MELEELRKSIDAIDTQMVALFIKRMETAFQIAACKKKQGLPVFIPEREAIVLEKVVSQACPDMQDYIRQLYMLIFEISKDYQNKQT